MRAEQARLKAWPNTWAAEREAAAEKAAAEKAAADRAAAEKAAEEKAAAEKAASEKAAAEKAVLQPLPPDLPADSAPIAKPPRASSESSGCADQLGVNAPPAVAPTPPVRPKPRPPADPTASGLY